MKTRFSRIFCACFLLCLSVFFITSCDEQPINNSSIRDSSSNTSVVSPSSTTSSSIPSSSSTPSSIDSSSSEHTHDWSSLWSANHRAHWHKCTGCDEKTDSANHTWSDWEYNPLNHDRHMRYCLICGFKETANHHGGTATYSSPAICTVCHQPYGPILTDHIPSDTWSSDSSYHWHECTSPSCEEPLDLAEHSFGDFTYQEDYPLHSRECSVCGFVDEDWHRFESYIPDPNNPHEHISTCLDCGYVEHLEHYFSDWSADPEDQDSQIRFCYTCGYVETSPHNFEDVSYLHLDSNNHYRQCLDCGYVEISPHNFEDWAIDDEYPNLHSRNCTDCGFHEDATHTLGDWVVNPNNPDEHIQSCTLCDYHQRTPHYFGVWNINPENKLQHMRECLTCHYVEYEEHYGGTATCNILARCEACLEEYGELLPHTLPEEYDFNDTHHWKTCEFCHDSTIEYGPHDGEWISIDGSTHKFTCETCGYEKTDSHYFENGYEPCICGLPATITIVRNTNSSMTLTDLTTEYGFEYYTTALDLGIPTSTGKTFAGWYVKNEDDDIFFITDGSGLFTGVWENTSDYSLGSATPTVIYADYSVSVSLEKTIGDWSDFAPETTRTITIRNGDTLDPTYIPIRTNDVFVGYFSEEYPDLNTTDTWIINPSGVVISIDALSNGDSLYATWASIKTSTTIMVFEEDPQLFAIRTPKWYTYENEVFNYEVERDCYIELAEEFSWLYQVKVYDLDVNEIEATSGSTLFTLMSDSVYIVCMTATSDDIKTRDTILMISEAFSTNGSGTNTSYVHIDNSGDHYYLRFAFTGSMSCNIYVEDPVNGNIREEDYITSTTRILYSFGSGLIQTTTSPFTSNDTDRTRYYAFDYASDTVYYFDFEFSTGDIDIVIRA